MLFTRCLSRVVQKSLIYSSNKNVLLLNVRSQYVKPYGTSSEDQKEQAKEQEAQKRLEVKDAKSKHFKKLKEQSQQSVKDATGNWVMPHPIWSEKELISVKIKHREPKQLSDRLAYRCVWALRQVYDTTSFFRFGKRTEKKWLTRIVFLETVAGVPGMTGAMLRHFRSLRRMQRDWGWIHTLLEEAENERMHLMTAVKLRQPGWLFRGCVLISQGIFANVFFMAYVVSPRFCHRFVGYLEEEAVKTYTQCLADIDDENGPLTHWKTQVAPEIAREYWNLGPEATMRDVILAIRADEAHHRDVNHEFADMKQDEVNPYKPGE